MLWLDQIQDAIQAAYQDEEDALIRMDPQFVSHFHKLQKSEVSLNEHLFQISKKIRNKIGKMGTSLRFEMEALYILTLLLAEMFDILFSLSEDAKNPV